MRHIPAGAVLYRDGLVYAALSCQAADISSSDCALKMRLLVLHIKLSSLAPDSLFSLFDL